MPIKDEEQRNEELKKLVLVVRKHKNGFTVLDIAGQLRWPSDKTRRLLLTLLTRKHLYTDGKYMFIRPSLELNLESYGIKVETSEK